MFSEDTSYRMRQLLRLVVTHGTGRKADAPGFRIGGKTGTAEKLPGGRYTPARWLRRSPAFSRWTNLAMWSSPCSTSPRPPPNLRLPHRRLERRAGRISKTVSRIAPMLGIRPDKSREPNMAEVLPFVHGKAEH